MSRDVSRRLEDLRETPEGLWGWFATLDHERIGVRHLLAALGLGLALAAGSCDVSGRSPLPSMATGGDPDQGRQLIRAFGCGSCHIVPGVRGAQGMVGPPLTHFARRTYIAGEAPNSPVNLVRWLRNPQSIEPGTAMPNLGLDEKQARAVAAYLYRLQ